MREIARRHGDPGPEDITFGEIADALTPQLAPGVTRDQLFASLKAAQVTGGFDPQSGPQQGADVTAGTALKATFAAVAQATGPRCPSCGTPEGGAHHQHCTRRQPGDPWVPLPLDRAPIPPGAIPLGKVTGYGVTPMEIAPPPLPADFITPAQQAAIAATEMLADLVAAGMPSDSAERIIALIVVAAGREAQDGA